MNSSLVPDDVENDIFEIWISVVAVRVPAAGAQINFHVAGARRVIADLQNGAAKIRPALGAGKAGMKNADDSPVGGFERVALEALMLPDGLQQAFGRRTVSSRNTSPARRIAARQSA